MRVDRLQQYVEVKNRLRIIMSTSLYDLEQGLLSIHFVLVVTSD